MTANDELQLRDENVCPDQELLQKVLGFSYPAFVALLELFDRNGLTHEWRYYKDGKAWLCKVKKKKKTIAWMSARKGYMIATIYLPLRLLNELLELDISEPSKENIQNTKNVGKSKPCSFELRDEAVLVDFEKVMQFKIKAK